MIVDISSSGRECRFEPIEDSRYSYHSYSYYHIRWMRFPVKFRLRNLKQPVLEYDHIQCVEKAIYVVISSDLYKLCI